MSLACSTTSNHPASTDSNPSTSRRAERALKSNDKVPCPARTPPGVSVALALIVGICVDRYVAGPKASTWILLSFIFPVLAAILIRWPRVSAALICLSFVSLGAVWHYFRWNERPTNDLSRSIDDVPRPVWLKGLLVDSLGFRAGRTAEESGATRFVLKTVAAQTVNGWQPCSGRILVIVSGDRSGLAAGTSVKAAGNISTVSGPLNPGEFDYRAFLQAEGIRLRLSIGDSVGIWGDDGASRTALSWTDAFEATLGRVRSWSRRRLTEGLEPRTAGLASALLLGRREGVDPELNDAFAQTGTTHLLAISGLHLQVLAFAFGAAFRGIGLSRRKTYALVAIATLAYALLVGMSPSVVRSAAMTITICTASVLRRRDRQANTLALAIIVTLALNPAHLFDIGCQLSFLAVGAIYWVVGPLIGSVRNRRRSGPLDVVEAYYESRSWKRLRNVRASLEESVILSVVVWLAALPLVALVFHLVSPISIALNIPLVPITSLALFSSGLTLITSLVWQPLSFPFAKATTILLDLTETIVRWGGGRSWGSWYVSEPNSTWVVGLYLLGVATVAARASRRSISMKRLSIGVFSTWFILGLSPLLGRRAAPPRAEILAVGHGLAVMIETGPGRAILYDCGRMRDPSVGRRIIAPALWARGISSIDQVIISHADADHYNGLHDLIERFQVREVVIAEHFETDRNPAIAELLKPVRKQGIPISVATAGRRWRSADGRLEFAILHPSKDFSPLAPDNARSLVLDVSDGKHHLLLTGDIEGVGLAAMLASPIEPSPEVFLAPHHGGFTANPQRLYDWAKPGQVVVSQRSPQPGARDALAELSVPVFRTCERGALRLTWERNTIQIEGFLDRHHAKTD